MNEKGHQLGRDHMMKVQAYMWNFFKRHPKHQPVKASPAENEAD